MAVRRTKAEREADKADAYEQLRDMLERSTPRDREGRPTMYVTCLHVARSGMSRAIVARLVVDGEIRDVSEYVSDLIGDPIHPVGGVRVTGCGMDMGFHLVSTVAHYLYREDRPGWAVDPTKSAHYLIAHRWQS